MDKSVADCIRTCKTARQEDKTRTGKEKATADLVLLTIYMKVKIPKDRSSLLEVCVCHCQLGEGYGM